MTSTHQPEQQQQLPNNSASKQGKLPKMHSWSAIAAIGTSSEGKTKPVKIMPTSTSPLTAGEGVQVGLDLGPVVGEEQQIVKSRGKAANAAVVATASTRVDKPGKTHKTEGCRSSNSGNGSNSSNIGKNMISESNAASAKEAKPIVSRKNPWKILSVDNAEIKATAVGDAATPTPAESKDMKAPITVKRSLPSSSASSSSKVDNNHKCKTNSGQSLNQPSSNRSNNRGQQNRNNSKSPKSKQQSNKTSLVKQKRAMEHGKQDKVQNTTIVSQQTASSSVTAYSSSESSAQQSQPDSISPKKSQGNKHRNKKEHQNNKNKDRNNKYHHQGVMNRANNNKNKKDKRNKNNNNKRKKKKNEDINNPHRLYKHTGKLPLTQQQITKLKPKAVAQVEYFFSTTELAKNVFLRSYMDCAGFVPFAIIYNFPSISSYQIPYMDLLVAVGDLSRKVEIDLINECVRIKSTSSKAENKNDEEQDAIYKKWLFPNPDGTLGCPRWIKEVEAEEKNQSEGSTDEEEGALSKNGEVLVNGKESVDKKGKLKVGEVDEEDSSSDTSASTSMDSDQQSFSEKQQEHEQQQLMAGVTVTNGQE